MCLIPKKDETDKLKKSRKTAFTGYKIYRVIENEIWSGFMYDVVVEIDSLQPKKNIIHKSNRHRKTVDWEEKHCAEIEQGIHVFLSEENAEKIRKRDVKTRILVPVQCFKRNLVAAGVWSDNTRMKQAVFTQVTIQSDDLINAVNKLLKRKK